MDMDLNKNQSAMDNLLTVFLSSNFLAHQEKPGINTGDLYFISNVVFKLEPSTSIENVYCQYKALLNIQLQKQPILYLGKFAKTILDFKTTLSAFSLTASKTLFIRVDFDNIGIFEYYF